MNSLGIPVERQRYLGKEVMSLAVDFFVGSLTIVNKSAW
jgi:hypothetical protein